MCNFNEIITITSFAYFHYKPTNPAIIENIKYTAIPNATNHKYFILPPIKMVELSQFYTSYQYPLAMFLLF